MRTPQANDTNVPNASTAGADPHELLTQTDLLDTASIDMLQRCVRYIFCKAMPYICKKDTAVLPGAYNRHRSLLHGHSDIVTLLAQELFGGNIRRRVVTDQGFRYENILPDGEIADFLTDDNSGIRQDKHHEFCTRDAVLREFNVMTRYTRLRRRFFEKLPEDIRKIVEAYTQLRTDYQSALLNSPHDLSHAEHPAARQSGT